MDNYAPIVDKVVQQYDKDPANLVMILQDVQNELNYLPSEAINLLSQTLNLPEALIYSVSTFYKSFSLEPRGKHRLDICEGTACHIRGASMLMSQISDELKVKPGHTTADGEVTLNSVRCVGACAMGPVAIIDGEFYGNMTVGKLSKKIKKRCAEADVSFADQTAASGKGEIQEYDLIPRITGPEHFEKQKSQLQAETPVEQARVLVCNGTGCKARGSLQVAEALSSELEKENLDIPVTLGIKKVGCHGLCEKGPLVILYPENIYYTGVKPEDAEAIIQDTVVGKRIVDRLLYREHDEDPGIKDYTEIPFYAGQKKIALRNVGTIDPLDIRDYINHGGYSAFFKALQDMSPGQVIEEVKLSGLRGRGGGGFPTGQKWSTTAAIDSDLRYVICNGDEGDPGAFMDCSIMEGDPHSIIEGMLICAYAVGSSSGYIYVREEYPRALKHLHLAIEQARAAGLLGNNIAGTGFSFDIKINRGAGAFVCGESTALMQSVEGRVGEPRAKYIRSAERGLYDKPTVLNNVETYANVPEIINKGAGWFSSFGTEKNKGTKVFSVVGKVQNTGLVEVPMGTSLRTIIFDICGGIKGGKPFKAVQTGGPSGGCLPESKLDLPVDFDTLTREGSMMGSGGMIVMDEDTCMVDVARYFTSYLVEESCGKCSACRMSLVNLHSILERICGGEGEEDDLEKLEKLLVVLENGSLCGLGKSAPNPVRSTLTHFRDEYVAHIKEKRCPSGVCRNLITYEITDNCTGCRLCAEACPQEAISGDKKEKHHIDQEFCNQCGICKVTCNFDAVVTKS